MSSLPIVCVFGAKDIKLVSPPCPDFETREMDVRCYPDESNLGTVLAKDRPSVIVSFGDISKFPNLTKAPEFVRRTWMHFENTQDLEEKGNQVFNCFIHNVLFQKCDRPLVSVITPTFRTGDKIDKPFRSLLAQTYSDWEWILYDDSDDNGETFKRLSALADQDGRIRVYKERKHSGRIGTVKRTACGIARGEFLVELDHDDELTPKALQWIVEAFQVHPEAGFCDTDFAECFEDGTPWQYVQGWGLGYGSYREEVHGGVKYAVCNSPHINAKVIRHIVAAPNHARAWRKSFYDSIGGHHDGLEVADDYALMVETFLHTRMVHIPRFAYVQHRSLDGTVNTTFVRNKEIQRLVRYISMAYDRQIHARLLELGVDDFVWQEGVPSFYRMMQVPNPAIESHCTIIYDPKS